MRFHGSTLLAAAALLCSTTALSDENPAGTSRPEYSVLTPAMERQLDVSAGLDPARVIPFVGNAQDYVHRGDSIRLRGLIDAEHYDAPRTIADRLIDALAEAGHSAVFEPMTRKPPGSIQSLSWSDLPESPKGDQLIDVTIKFICLCRECKDFDFFPALALEWRVLDSRQSVVVEPTRSLVYVHSPVWNAEKPSHTQTRAAAADAPKYPSVEVSENCRFKKPDDAFQDTTRLWGCFGKLTTSLCNVL